MKQTLLLLLFVFGLSLSMAAQVSIRPGSQVDIQKEMRVFPNPASDNFEVSATDRITLIRVYNLVGREVKKYPYEKDQQYYVGDLPRGMYLIQMIGANNEAIITRRLNKK